MPKATPLWPVRQYGWAKSYSRAEPGNKYPPVLNGCWRRHHKLSRMYPLRQLTHTVCALL